MLKLTLVFAAVLAVAYTEDVGNPNYVVCYYDTKGSFRKGEASFHPKYLAEAAQYCTHLVYGYAAINKNHYTLEPSIPFFDVDQYKTYREVVNLKNTYPDLRVLLSVGGGRDLDQPEKYLTLLEYPEKRKAFIHSATELVKKHGFDGLDLAWQFPQNKPKQAHSGFWSSAWSVIKKPFVSGTVDPKAHEHREQFADLVRDLKGHCNKDGLNLTLSVLPNVNSTWYFNIPRLIPNLDLVNLWAFDYYTPDRSIKEADDPASIYQQTGRKYDENGEYLVDYWCENGASRHKLILGIPTYARTWKTTKHLSSCVPPIHDVEGPGLPGPHTKEAGLLSYREIYSKLQSPHTLSEDVVLIKSGFHKLKYVTHVLYASDGAPHKDTWAGFDDPDTVRYKATFARIKKLGGVAIIDLTLDDFKGACTGIKYPLLRAVYPENEVPKVPVTTIPSSNVNVEVATATPDNTAAKKPITHENTAVKQPTTPVASSSVNVEVATATPDNVSPKEVVTPETSGNENVEIGTAVPEYAAPKESLTPDTSSNAANVEGVDEQVLIRDIFSLDVDNNAATTTPESTNIINQ